jgi:hypothetical protein
VETLYKEVYNNEYIIIVINILNNFLGVMTLIKKKLKPVLDGDFWMIGGNPNLGDLQGPLAVNYPQECVDHHVFQSEDGMWHLWGCIRGTKVGRILYHWRSDALINSNWEKTGEIIRASKPDGESINSMEGGVFIQSPFVVKHNGEYYMFYGGHNTGFNKDGVSVDTDEKKVESQMCLMHSKDGRNWVRHKNEKGYSSIFVGPGETRDPALIQIDGIWHMYYAGYEYPRGDEARNELVSGFWVRTSVDLINWSEEKLVHRDRSEKFGLIFTDCECPHVVFREGYYYLFRTQDYAQQKTHVFRSEDPYNFGIGDASDKYVCSIEVGAPEIILDSSDQEYITSNHDLRGGTMMCKLKWVEE